MAYCAVAYVGQFENYYIYAGVDCDSTEVPPPIIQLQFSEYFDENNLGCPEEGEPLPEWCDQPAPESMQLEPEGAVASPASPAEATHGQLEIGENSKILRESECAVKVDGRTAKCRLYLVETSFSDPRLFSRTVGIGFEVENSKENVLRLLAAEQGDDSKIRVIEDAIEYEINLLS